MFSKNQWTFEWGMKISKMKIPEHFCQKILCFFENQWTFEWGPKILKMKILANFCQKSLCFFKTNGLLNGKSQEMIDFLQTSTMADFHKKKFKKKSKNLQKMGTKFPKVSLTCPPPKPPSREFRKAPGSAELTCFCAPTFPSFA